MKNYHLTLSRRDGIAPARLLSAPNKSAYLRQLVRRDIDDSRGARDDVNYPALDFELDESQVGRNASICLKLRETTDADVINMIESQGVAPSKYLRRLILTDAYGPAYKQVQAMAKAAKRQADIAAGRAPEIFTLNTVITMYMPDAIQAVKQLSYQTNISGYIKNLIRRDMGLPERPLSRGSIATRNFKRHELFADKTLINTWRQHKATAEQLRLKINSILEQAYALLPADKRAALRGSVADFKVAQAKVAGDADMEHGDTTEKLQTSMQIIQCEQGVIRSEALQLLASSDAELYAEYVQATQEHSELRAKLVSFNKKLNSKGVKRIPIKLRLNCKHDPELVEWLRNREFVKYTDLADYDYWLHAKRNYRDGEEQEYVRQLGNCYGFYFTQLIVKDVEEHDYGDRATQ